MARTSMLEAVKLQARALIPVVKALEAELGKERAHRIVGDAIADSWAERLAARTTERDAHPGWEFRRTRMHGAPACDFRWKRKVPRP